MCVIGITLLVIGVTGCGEKVDPEEQREAENLIQGLNVMGMMTNVDAYDDYTLADGPPLNWTGPNEYEMPYGADSFYENTFWRIPLDSMETFIDTIIWLAMPEPDVWGADSDSVWTGIDTWFIGKVRNKIYFHTQFSIEDPDWVTGEFEWHWEETWYNYAYQIAKLTEGAEIDITTSANIGLSAQFRFADDGSGTTAENFASWNNTQFVRFEFFAQPQNDYDGYYLLLSEAWKVEHYFKLVKYQET